MRDDVQNAGLSRRKAGIYRGNATLDDRAAQKNAEREIGDLDVSRISSGSAGLERTVDTRLRGSDAAHLFTSVASESARWTAFWASVTLNALNSADVDPVTAAVAAA